MTLIIAGMVRWLRDGPARTFWRDARGALAAWFGVSLIPLMLLAGAGMDLGRSVNQKAELQGAADAAALAGAGAYTSSTSLATATTVATTYMANFKAATGLPLTYTVTASTSTNGASVTLYKMTVTATAPIANSLMSLVRTSNTTSVTATAQNPVYSITINLSSFNSSAADLDTISYYIVPQDNSAPALSDTTVIFSNAAPAGTASTTITLTASQKIGFLLTNTTGGKPVTTCIVVIVQVCTTTYPNFYGFNQYGGAPGSIHYVYSHMFPPSKIAYPWVTSNCSLQVLTSGAAPASGTCFSTLPANAAVNCLQASGQTLSFNWNDMGGILDDKDYNDAVYTVACTKVDSSVSKGLALTH